MGVAAGIGSSHESKGRAREYYDMERWGGSCVDLPNDGINGPTDDGTMFDGSGKKDKKIIRVDPPNLIPELEDYASLLGLTLKVPGGTIDLTREDNIGKTIAQVLLEYRIESPDNFSVEVDGQSRGMNSKVQKGDKILEYLAQMTGGAAGDEIVKGREIIVQDGIIIEELNISVGPSEDGLNIADLLKRRNIAIDEPKNVSVIKDGIVIPVSELSKATVMPADEIFVGFIGGRKGSPISREEFQRVDALLSKGAYKPNTIHDIVAYYKYIVMRYDLRDDMPTPILGLMKKEPLLILLDAASFLDKQYSSLDAKPAIEKFAAAFPSVTFKVLASSEEEYRKLQELIGVPEEFLARDNLEKVLADFRENKGHYFKTIHFLTSEGNFAQLSKEKKESLKNNRVMFNVFSDDAPVSATIGSIINKYIRSRLPGVNIQFVTHDLDLLLINNLEENNILSPLGLRAIRATVDPQDHWVIKYQISVTDKFAEKQKAHRALLERL